MIRSRSRTNLVLSVALALVFAASGVATAQAPPPAASETIDVSEVLLDVVVTDRRGNVVLGLDEDDFVVEENGEPVEVRDATFYSHRRFLESSARARELGILAEDVPVERHFVLFFHDQRRLFSRLAVRQMETGLRARQWTESELEPTDRVAVVSFDTSLELHQDFTNDRSRIERAIEAAARGDEPVAARATRQPEGAPSLAARLTGDPARVEEALEAIGRALDPIRGRKNLILFSVGFGEVDRLGFFTPDPRYYPDMVRALNDANVAVYAIDLMPGATFVGPRPLSGSLSAVAADTGGRSYLTYVNPLTALEQVTADTNGYYLLAYSRPEGTAGSGYQKVDVDTRNPEFRVRAREGYRIGRGAAVGEPTGDG